MFNSNIFFTFFAAICLRQGQADQALSMSGLQHPLEANGGRSAHVMTSYMGPPAGNGSMAAVSGSGQPPPSNAATLPQPHTTLMPPGGSTYIRAGAPHIPPPTTAVQPMGQSQAPAEFNRNPLLCILCNQAFQNPCLLACYHTFCAACLRGRAVDGKLACPLCGWVILKARARRALISFIICQAISFLDLQMGALKKLVRRPMYKSTQKHFRTGV